MSSQNTMPTLAEAFEEYLQDRPDLRQTSLFSYRSAFKRVYPEIANAKLDEIKFSDLKRMYSHMRYQDDNKPSTIEVISSIINPVFTTAVQDDVIAKNPNSGALKAAAKGEAWHKVHRSSVSVADQKAFLKFVHDSDVYRRWENLFVFLFGTGCRVGEAIGLTWDNVDFDNRQITIDHTVSYLKNEFVTNPPKTKSGYRTIPMCSEVKTALEKELIISQILKAHSDAYPKYVFTNSKGKLIHPTSINEAIKRVVKDYNACHLENPMACFSVHQTRNTFASRLCENDINIKVIQSIMGHSSIETTMDIYTDITDEKKRYDFSKIEGKLNLG